MQYTVKHIKILYITAKTLWGGLRNIKVWIHELRTVQLDYWDTVGFLWVKLMNCCKKKNGVHFSSTSSERN